MMYKNEIYPKTPRMKELGDRIVITEKIDGSNLTFFKYEGELYVALRKMILTLPELAESEGFYPGLKEFLAEFGELLQNELCEKSAICGEWLGMGNIKYDFDVPWLMFAKANVKWEDEKFKLYNICYDYELFIYPFASQAVPGFIMFVPLVAEVSYLPDKRAMDKLYDEYCAGKDRPVEGFVMHYGSYVQKYVRMKRGKIVEYKEEDRKGN